MLILTTTNETQGARKNDFCWTDEGEVAFIGFACDRGSIDDACGCRRSFSGATTLKASTTARVVDVPDMTIERLTKIMRDALKAGGFIASTTGGMARQLAQYNVAIAAAAGLGAIVERRGSRVARRSVDIVHAPSTEDVAKTHKAAMRARLREANDALDRKWGKVSKAAHEYADREYARENRR